jgi:hypothetical protein
VNFQTSVIRVTYVFKNHLKGNVLDTLLLLTKFSAVLTVIYAGLNIHQLTSPYAYLVAKAEEFRLAVMDSGGIPRLARLNILFYVVMPFAYLALLRLSALQIKMVAVLAIKFICSAAIDIWIERSILTGKNYSLVQHYLSRVDNLLNLLASVWVVLSLLRGISLGF